jgi:hypothetical protein
MKLEDTVDKAPSDATLGGYIDVHNRPPAFEGPDGCPYTVSVEVEKTPNLVAPFSGYLVFPRWAETGLGVVDHVESRTVVEGRDPVEVEADLRSLTLSEVKVLLDEAIEKRERGDE